MGADVQEIMINKEKNNNEFKKNLNILIADDSLRIQQIIGLMLESIDCNLVMVTNGKKVLEALEKDDYDLILMDLQMPEMNGIEATTHIRAMEQGTGRHIPILAMTGFHLENGRQKCINAGMDDYLEKPFKIEELLETIARLTRTKLSSKG